MDDTMSQETAFTDVEQKDDVFQFDPVDTASEEGADSAITEDKLHDVSEAEEAEESRVPYSRFKKKQEELEQSVSMIEELEERLSALESRRQESNSSEDIEIPKEWVELYGDSDVSKRAYAIQLQREERLQENAVKIALEQFKNQAYQEEQAVEENEEILDQQLDSLQQSIGKKLNSQTEEDILSIVDEFSPVGADGKYITLFPFDKAYEIYQLRNSKQQQKTVSQRTQVASLTGNSSEGETDSSETSFKRGWDSWRDAI